MINEVRVEYDDKITSLENQLAAFENLTLEKTEVICSQEREIKMLNSQLEATMVKFGKIEQTETNANENDQKLKEAEEKIEKL